MKRPAPPLATLWVVGLLGLAAGRAPGAAPGPVRIDANAVTAGRCTIRVSDAALPAQIRIRPDRGELPLERRLDGGEPTRAELQFIGRGERLRGPIRLEAVSPERTAAARVVQPARLKPRGGRAQAQARLQVGPYAVGLACTYAGDGSVVLELTASGGRDEDLLRLVIEPVEPVDLAFRSVPEDPPGTHPPEKLDAYLPNAEGVAWDGARRTTNNHVRQIYVGSADAGLSLLCPDAPRLAPQTSHLTLTRDQTRRLTWQTVLLAGKAGRARLALLVHPVRSRPPAARREAWLRFPRSAARVRPHTSGPRLLGGAALPAAEGDAVAGGLAPNRPGYLAVAARARYAELRGPAAADMLSRRRDNVALYPISLFRAAACGPTGLVARVRSNARALPAADAPSLDRQIFARALLHDIGAAMAGVRQPTEFFTLTRALRAFGYFADDGLTEYLPYWRLEGIARYGEAFNPDSAFNLTESNPAAGTYVSVFRRPYQREGRRGVQAMFVVVNERDEPVRHRLYVLDLQRIFGPGLQRLHGGAVVRAMDFGKVPDDSDWRTARVAKYFGDSYGLRDLENGGYVRASSNKGTTAEIYGPLYVPAHDYRLVWAYGLPGEDAEGDGGAREAPERAGEADE
jgi:hypothetical protein